MSEYTPVIGLEIHVELKTKSKMFCGCDAHHFQVKPNTHTCPVCLGLPGALPVPNRKAIEWCQLIGLALNCQLANQSKFDRKNYFYPDLSKGYQISQYDQPLCFKGNYELTNGKRIGITRVHMEEDTGKSVHRTINGEKLTLVDFNRSGVPLVEIVTEPDFRNSDEVDEFLKGLQKIIRFLGVSDADMEKGSMRLEVNMSLGKDPKSLPNYKVEVKNINSFRYVKKAIEYEFIRQTEILDRGDTPIQETRGYQEDVDKTISQRSKEEAQDYRYFPDPDIPPMEFNEADFDKIREQLPELPQVKSSRYQKSYNLDRETALFLTETPAISAYFEAVLKRADANTEAKTIANLLKNKKVDWRVISQDHLVEQLKSGQNNPQMDPDELEEIVRKVLNENPDVVAKYKAGKTAVLGYLVGQVMRESKGKAEAKTIAKIFEKSI